MILPLIFAAAVSTTIPPNASTADLAWVMAAKCFQSGYEAARAEEYIINADETTRRDIRHAIDLARKSCTKK